MFIGNCAGTLLLFTSPNQHAEVVRTQREIPPPILGPHPFKVKSNRCDAMIPGFFFGRVGHRPQLNLYILFSRFYGLVGHVETEVEYFCMSKT